jgi:hypothetical protein
MKKDGLKVEGRDVTRLHQCPADKLLDIDLKNIQPEITSPLDQIAF